MIGAYYGISALGFGTLNYLGISYIDDRILWAGIPMMVALAGLGLWVQPHRRAMIDPRQLWFQWDHTPLFLIPFLTLATIIGVFVEATMSNMFTPLLISATVLALLIGFAEEAIFRRYLLELANGQSAARIGLVFIYSVLSFAFVHMMNIFSGLSVGEAFSQSLYTVKFGIVAALIYLVTKNFLAIACWHAVTDYGLFVSQIGDFQSVGILGQVIDWVMWVSTALAALYAVVRFGRYVRNTQNPQSTP